MAGQKTAFTLIAREFKKYLYGDAQVPWRVAETERRRGQEKQDLFATNGFVTVVVTDIGHRAFRLTAYSKSGRSVKTVIGASNVYHATVGLLNEFHA